MSWKHLLAYITATVDQELLLRNEYLVTENRILRHQITGRVRLTDGERKALAEIGQGTHNAIIAPGTVLLRYTHHQVLYLLVDHGATRSFTLLRAVKLLGHELPVPAKDRVRRDDRGHFFEGLLAELLTNFGQRFALAVTQPYTTFDLVSQHTIFGDEVLIT